jgi:hypothetical protein
MKLSRALAWRAQARKAQRVHRLFAPEVEEREADNGCTTEHQRQQPLAKRPTMYTRPFGRGVSFSRNLIDRFAPRAIGAHRIL